MREQDTTPGLPPLTRQNFDAILEFLPLLSGPTEAIGADIEQSLRKDGEGGSWFMGVWEATDETERFLHALDIHNWVSLSADYPTWAKTNEGAAVMSSPHARASASVDDVRMALTAIVRSDRVCEGNLWYGLRSGLVAELVSRIAVLRDELFAPGSQTRRAQVGTAPAAIVGQIPLRLVVYEATDPASVSRALASVGVNTALHATWDIPSIDAAKRDSVAHPCWLWSGSERDFLDTSSVLLREFIYPLVQSGSPFLLGLPVSRGTLARRSMEVSERRLLDLEDIGTLLERHAVGVTPGTLSGVAGRVAMTPIEHVLSTALTKAGVAAAPQVRLGRYIADFVVDTPAGKLVIEADGREFHDAMRDAKRDAALQELGVWRVLRFTGAAIWRDAESCAAEVCRVAADGTRHGSPRGALDNDLDADQRAAATHVGGPVRVLAPAGAGKTKTMINRVCTLVERGVSPSSILVLAFNVKAKDQLVERLRERRIPVNDRHVYQLDEPGVVCATFNAFGRRYGEEVCGIKPDLVDKTEVRLLMTRALADADVDLAGVVRGGDPVGGYMRELERVRNELLPTRDAIVEVEFRDGPRELPFAEAYEAYQQHRLRAGVGDYTDQVHTAVVDLLVNPSHRSMLQERFDHVLVDEYQDLNEAQIVLADIITRPNRAIFAVGDDDQLIYGWRHARSDNILRFHDRQSPPPFSRSYVLNTNYRCAESIVAASRRLIDHNRDREEKDTRARVGAPQGFVRVAAHDGVDERLGVICRLFWEQKRADGPSRRWADFAVLTRYKAQQPLVAMALDQAGIPRSRLLTYRLYSHPQMRLLRDYLRLVHDPGSLDAGAIAGLLNRPNRYIKNATVEWLERESDGYAALRRMARAAEDRGEAPDLVELVRRRDELAKRQERSPLELLSDVVDEFELRRYWRNELRRRGDADEGDPLHLLEVIQARAGDHESIETFLAHWDQAAAAEESGEDMADDNLEREQDEHRDAVVLGTIHAAKGCEYHTVGIFDYDPDVTRMDEHDREDERRVLYVGMTRAIHTLILTVNTRREGLHPFLKEALAAASPGETQRLGQQQHEVRDRRQSLVPRLVAVQDSIGRIVDGQELANEQTRLAALESERVTLEKTTSGHHERLTALHVSVRPEVETEDHHRAAARGFASDIAALDDRIRVLLAERSAQSQERSALEHRRASLPARAFVAAGIRQRRALRRVVDLLSEIANELERLRGERVELDSRRDQHERCAEAIVVSRALAAAELELVQQDASIAAARGRIAVLEREPELIAAPLRDELAELDREQARLGIEFERIAGRLVELELLSR